MRYIWSQQDIKKLIKLYPHNSNRDIEKIMGIPLKKIKDKGRRLYLLKLNKCYKWKKNQIDDLYKYYPDNDVDFLEKHFKLPIDKIYRKATSLKIKKTDEYIKIKQIAWVETIKKHGISHRFNKGQEPWNKGVSGYMGANKTSFRKGNLPKNFVEVGSERLDKDGYTLIKIENPNKWKLKHRKIWEDNFGEIPKSHSVIFLDGNRTNFDLFNLILVHRRDLLYMNRYGKYPEDIMETQKLIYKLKNLIRHAKEQD